MKDCEKKGVHKQQAFSSFSEITFFTKIFEIIMELNKSGMTILLVEQNVYQALQILHRGYVIQKGEIILQGKGTELIHNEKIKEAYLA